MNEQQNVQVVRDAYAAFQRGDIAHVLERVSDDVEWQLLGPAEIPNSGLRRGRQEVTRFFQDVAATWAIEVFEPRQFVAQGDTVVVLGRYAGKAKATQRPYGGEFAHVFTLRDGKVTHYVEFGDTAMLMAALALVPARA